MKSISHSIPRCGSLQSCESPATGIHCAIRLDSGCGAIGIFLTTVKGGDFDIVSHHSRWSVCRDVFPESSGRKTLDANRSLRCHCDAMKHVLSALVMNQPGVLAHISGMLASRGYNIDSLAVGETENPEFSRMTFVVAGDSKTLQQVRKQLEKIVTVVKVLDYSSESYVERDLMLMKVAAEKGRRSEIKELVEIFRGKIVDVSPAHVIVEISGTESKIESFIDLMRPFGVLEMVRSGRIALLRGTAMSAEAPLGEPEHDAV